VGQGRKVVSGQWSVVSSSQEPEGRRQRKRRGEDIAECGDPFRAGRLNHREHEAHGGHGDGETRLSAEFEVRSAECEAEGSGQ
jgi:hypothetical protein